MTPAARARILVLGLNDVASAVAHRLFSANLLVALHAEAAPITHRRLMAFADAWWDETAVLDSVTCRSCPPARLGEAFAAGAEIPLLTCPEPTALASAAWSAVIDARMRKRATAPDLRGRARRVIGLGPGFDAGVNCDVAVETQWGDRLGAVIGAGPTVPLAGEPRSINGFGRERLVYAPVAGTMETCGAIGDAVSAGTGLATLGALTILAPISGTVRGLTRGGAVVAAGDKIAEIDPRPPGAATFTGLGARPFTIGGAVLEALTSA